MSITAGFASAEGDETQTIVEIIAGEGNFTIVGEALNDTSVHVILSGDGPYTVFLPTDEAFMNLPEEILDELLSDPLALRDAILYHIVEGKLTAADVANESSLSTLQGSALPVNVTEEGIFVGEAKIIKPDIEASNGIVHVIDAVLMLPEEPVDEGPEVLYDDTVTLIPGNFTFVPSNNASASYEIENFTDLGALSATGLDFKVSEMGKMVGNDSGNMTEKSLILESIEGIQNNNETQEKWFIVINGEQAPEDIGMNPVLAGDKVSFWYALEEGGEPVIEELQYVVNITVAEEVSMPNIIETAEAAGNFSTLLTAVEAANLTDTLSTGGPFTVFAPTDDAFAALPEGTLEELLNDTDMLTEILLYHVASGKLMAADVINLSTIMTLQGDELTVNVTEDGRVFVDGAEIILADIEASNGVIHVIDAVLVPPEEPVDEGPEVLFDDSVILSPGNFTFVPSNNASASYEIDYFTDLGALYASGLSFNASDEPFNATGAFLLESIEGIETNATKGEFWFVYINGEPAPAGFGLNPVSVGDKVSFWYALDEGGEAVIEEASYVVNITIAEEVSMPNIIETAEAAGNFSTLLAAVEAANLTDTLSTGGPFTVFAPTDDAFDALPEGTLEELLNDTDMLTEILLYHVASGKLMAADVVNLTNISTLQGDELEVNVTEDGRIFVDGAEIILADIEASNGVIHVIDAVLIPPEEPVEEKDIIDTATEEGNFSTLIAAIEAANLTDALKGDGPFTVFAPTDDAFAELPEGALEALLNDTDALKEVLLYHVADGKIMEADLTNVSNITTLQGEELPVNVTETGIMVGDANVTQTDIEASNGVIHVIDKVLIPPEKPPAKWYFFSIPFEAQDASVETLLAGVDYNALIFYNSSSKLFEDVSALEPLKGYWINVPATVEFNASEQFGPIGETPAAPPSIRTLNQGWNAVGSPAQYTLTADAAFISIADSYAKVIGPWVPDESGSGSYTYVGYNGLNGTLNENQIGTDIFEVEPYEGYWVYMKEEADLA